ncbi:2-succinyl-6-hydroxy-2,4-cyclohexadiene-1-carboxylate synthase [Caviibacterium pharyngocola]|uniref:Putative 2-succinyl-6-hydroxy-2,4-cyclohexadiene-1-carboxylate synthase n=1 Tax=Caviibacterium pharyngocola TaxID=28159 RepID=A0A2M8RY82_9PAST|nr:2-succinyl-6-hydroxy-2,4-cyclohexadiene-1-carboxylate synthase [Caviibacterium pharyngocola]PJG83850.1 2-succinyl-6-hydroxy-2,4-cyclohexadiene-1-carboxylate synthase [Caviibacterium pharyngocola]
MPVLVFLHGLLGTKADWQKVIEKLPHFDCLALDLPLHGEAEQQSVEDFEQCAHYVAQCIRAQIGERDYILTGYSLGGRIALYYALESRVEKGNLRAVIAEGAGLGLQTADEKHARWQNDCHWVQRFRQEPIEKVLQDWYRQAVFADLSDEQRAELIAQRCHNDGQAVAQMLQATSLAKQADFRLKVRSNLLPIFYVCGERDQKFRRLAQENALNARYIADAGHNAHKENPQGFADCVQEILKSFD